MPKTRQERIDEFRHQLYLNASFFKMKTVGSPTMDAKINESVAGVLRPFPHPQAKVRIMFPKEEK